MKTVFITGSLGLIGYETTLLYLQKGYQVVGIDNDMRGRLFNIKTQYKTKLSYLKKNNPQQYIHFPVDIRDAKKMEGVFKIHGEKTWSVVHTAAQTSHDWAKKDPLLDFSINAQATLQLLEFYKKYSPKASFIFCSTNKVYGDLVNQLPFVKSKTRFDLSKAHPYFQGVPESFSIDQSTHSLFGSSKVAADILIQEYGRYYHLKTGVFRLGVITGEHQSGALEQGFLSYLVNKVIKDRAFTVIGYEGLQVRDILHAQDVAKAFFMFAKQPRSSSVYNLGGGRENAASVLELLNYVSKKLSQHIKIDILKKVRTGDHRWWISDFSKFQKDYPAWRPTKTIYMIIDSIIDYVKRGKI